MQQLKNAAILNDSAQQLLVLQLILLLFYLCGMLWEKKILVRLFVNEINSYSVKLRCRVQFKLE